MKKHLQAFTLIELLVTIAIIGVLSTLSLVAVNSVRESGRDAKRKTDIETIRAALELYKADAGVYPAALPAVGASLTSIDGTKVYLSVVPDDPSTGRDYLYTVSSGKYFLCAALEGGTGDVNCAAGTGTAASCGIGINCNYETSSP